MDEATHEARITRLEENIAALAKSEERRDAKLVELADSLIETQKALHASGAETDRRIQELVSAIGD